MAQIVYYFWAAVHVGAPDRPVAFAVPTGNFGNVFAGYGASRMGLAVSKFIVAFVVRQSVMGWPYARLSAYTVLLTCRNDG